MSAKPTSTHFNMDLIRDKAEGLFAEAVAHGMHASFALNCAEWGRTYAEKLIDALLDARADLQEQDRKDANLG